MTTAAEPKDVEKTSNGETSGFVKVSFNLPESYVLALKALAKDRQSTVTEVLRRAISTEKFLAEEVEKGTTVLLKDKKGATQQVVFR